MITFIGLGGAGGNVANQAVKAGFNALAINFSQKDLDSLENIKHKLKIMGSEGVGQDREMAVRLVYEHSGMIVDFLKEHCSNPSIEVLMIPFATSGGSGSGISAILMDMISGLFPEKVLVAVAIMPDETEATVSQINCSSTFEELSQLNVCVFPIDNNQVYANNIHIGKSKLYQTTNETFVNLIQKVVSYTEKHSKNGNFDKKDFLTVIKQKGIAIMSESDITSINANLSPEGIAQAVQNSWEKSIFAPIEYSSVIKAGIIFDAQESLMQHLNHNLLFDKFSNGAPLYLFQGNYHESNGKVVTILSGLSWCKSRLAKVDEIIQNSKSKIESAVSVEQEVYQSKSSGVSALLKNSNKPKEKLSVDDILSKWRR